MIKEHLYTETYPPTSSFFRRTLAEDDIASVRRKFLSTLFETWSRRSCLLSPTSGPDGRIGDCVFLDGNQIRPTSDTPPTVPHQVQTICPSEENVTLTTVFSSFYIIMGDCPR